MPWKDSTYEWDYVIMKEDSESSFVSIQEKKKIAYELRGNLHWTLKESAPWSWIS
jgi:hypothetical protein